MKIAISCKASEALSNLVEQSKSAHRAKENRLGRFVSDHLNAEPKGICFIDLDRTLMLKTVAPLFGRWLYQQGELTYSSLCRALILWWRHRLGLLSFDYLVNAITGFALKGRTKDQLLFFSTIYSQSLVPELFNERVVAFMKQIYPTHLLVLASRSPDFLVGPIATLMGFDLWQASCWCSQKKSYRTIGGNDKADFFDSLLAALTLERVSSIAMSDSKDDIPLLQRAGRAVAVRPDLALRRLAMKGGWEIWNR